MRRTGAVSAVGAVGVLVLVLAACSGDVGEHGPGADRSDHGVHTGAAAYAPAALSQAGSAQDVVAATEALGMQMVGAGDPGANVITSPASAVFALTMLSEGAAGQTRTELEQLLGAEGQQRTEAMSALQGELAAYAGDPQDAAGGDLPEVPIAHLANNVMLDDQAVVHEEYLDTLSSAYDAGVQVTDLGSQEGKEALDAWVLENTGGLIEESSVDPDEQLRLVLQNAVLFAAQWASPFQAEYTVQDTFTLADGSPLEVPMMGQTTSAAHAEHNGWQAVRMPYTEGFYADILLPPQGTDPTEIDAEQAQALQEGLAAAESGPVALSVPKVDIAGELDLIPVLEGAGVHIAFSSDADLSEIAEEDLFVAGVAQQAVLQVDEAGTTAAAVTEAVVGATSGSVEEVRMAVDRPFIFRVAHAETGLSLFLAAVADPRG